VTFGIASRRVFRSPLRILSNVRREPHAVGHRHHHLAVDNRDRLQLFLHIPAAGLVRGSEATGLLRVSQRRNDRDRG
jgi:hypothetical protein